MHTGLRITAFAAALAATFGTAYGVGRGIDPVVANEAPAPVHEDHGEQSPTPEGGDGHAGHASAPAVGGLRASEGGYTLDLETTRVAAGRRTDLRFTVRDGDGRALTAYQREHDKELHLVLASRDLTTYRHLHPARAADGTWSTPSTCPGRAATGSSPTSPRRGREPRTSPSARTWRSRAPTRRRAFRRPVSPPRSTGTRSSSPGSCVRARPAN